MTDKQYMKRYLSMWVKESELFQAILEYIGSKLESQGCIEHGYEIVSFEYAPYVGKRRHSTLEDVRYQFETHYSYFLSRLEFIDGEISVNGKYDHNEDILTRRTYFIGANFTPCGCTILLNPMADFTLLLEATK